MQFVENIFGRGVLLDGQDLSVGQTYIQCTACMSIYSECNSWANAHKVKMTNNPTDAYNIVILGCQVTDLAVLNDIVTLEKLIKQFPWKRFYIGGCLARRFDIPLPEGVFRLDGIKSDYQWQNERLVDWAPPFWVKDYPNLEVINGKKIIDGSLFRDYYPLRISGGCKKKCKYCTIRVTRGESFQLDTQVLEGEFLAHDNVVLISDSPSAEEIHEWCNIAIRNKKKVSFRNVEPSVAVEEWEILTQLAEMKLLDTFHCPIQSNVPATLEAMYRPVKPTMDYIEKLVPVLKVNGVTVATNIIIDYLDFPNPDLGDLFDYVSWNPYWDGKWDRARAEERMKKYINKGE